MTWTWQYVMQIVVVLYSSSNYCMLINQMKYGTFLSVIHEEKSLLGWAWKVLFNNQYNLG